jgi:hypothetical protein
VFAITVLTLCVAAMIFNTETNASPKLMVLPLGLAGRALEKFLISDKYKTP